MDWYSSQSTGLLPKAPFLSNASGPLKRACSSLLDTEPTSECAGRTTRPVAESNKVTESEEVEAFEGSSFDGCGLLNITILIKSTSSYIHGQGMCNDEQSLYSVWSKTHEYRSVWQPVCCGYDGSVPLPPLKHANTSGFSQHGVSKIGKSLLKVGKVIAKPKSKTQRRYAFLTWI